MKKLLLILGLFSTFFSANAQKKMTLDQSVFFRDLLPTNFSQVSWINPQTIALSEDGQKIRFMYFKKDKFYFGKREITLASLNTQIAGKTSPLTFLPQITWKGAKFYFENELALFQCDTLGNCEKMTDWAQDISVYDLNEKFDVAFVKDFNLFVKERSGKTTQITRDGEANIVYGQTVHRSEFGIHKGLFWSPESSKLAFYRMDEKIVKDYPLVNYIERPAKIDNIKYPMAGEKSHHVTVGIFDVKSGKTVFLKTGEPAEQYLTNITWSPDAKKIYIAIVNREQNLMRLKRFNAETGEEEKTLFEEKNDKYVEPENGLFFLPNQSGNFIWQSERDGFNHLYLHDAEGNLLKQLTKGSELVTEITGFDAKGENVFFRHIGKRAVERHYSVVNVKTGKISLLTQEAGTHTAIFSPDGQFFYDNLTSLSVPRKISLKKIAEKGISEVQTLLTAGNPLKDYAAPNIEIGTLKAEDGTELFYRLIKPADFDAGKKYPVMVYVYGGPHAQMVTDTWRGGADYFSQYVAQEGFIVFTLDNRGSADRGLAFEQATFRQLGQNEMKDQLKGVEFLKSLPFVNAEKMAVYGWSFGGFMTTSLMLHHPGIFKTAVAGGPVMDWSLYEVMYTERYMDTPKENAEGYEKTSLLTKVDNLHGRLLLIHGQKDDVVVPQHTLLFMQKCIEKGKLLDTFFYPTHPHNVRGKDRIHLNKTIFDYLKRGLD